MKKYNLKIEGKSFEVEVISCDQKNAVISLNGKTFQVENLSSENEAPTTTQVSAPASSSKSTPKSSSGILKASLPGSIFKLNVKEGDAVKKGQVLLIMEAMKMENNVIAESDGVVKSIAVKVGDAVLQGDELMEIE